MTSQIKLKNNSWRKVLRVQTAANTTKHYYAITSEITDAILEYMTGMLSLRKAISHHWQQ